MPAKCPKCSNIIEKNEKNRFPSTCPHCGMILKVQKQSLRDSTVRSAPAAADASATSITREVKCPHFHCGKKIKSGPDGKFPARCPHCDLLLPSKKSPDRKVAQSTSPSSPPRRRRSEERDQDDEEDFVEKKRRRRRRDEDDDYDDDDDEDDDDYDDEDDDEDSNGLFADSKSSRSKSKSSKSTSPADLFADASDKKKGKKKKGGDPFGASSTSTRSMSDDDDDEESNIPWTPIILVTVLALGGAGFYFFGEDLMKKGGIGGGASEIQNLTRNYVFTPPNSKWKQEEKSGQGVDLVMKRSEPDGTIEIHSGESMEADLNELGDKALKDWETNLENFESQGTEDADLANFPAQKVTAKGTAGGRLIRREAYVMFNEGVWYRVVFSAPKSDFEDLVSEFSRARKNFKIVGSRPGWKDQLVSTAQAIDSKPENFYGKKAPYQLIAKGGWKENPGLNAGLLADLKMVSKDKHANIIVTPRKNSTIEKSMKAYVSTQEKKYTKAVLRDPQEGEKVSVDGADALRIKMAITEETAGEEFAIVTFIDGNEFIYQIECLAKAEKAADYEPIFAEIVDSFVVLNEIHNPGPTPEEIAKKKAEEEEQAKMKAEEEKKAKEAEEALAAKKKKSSPSKDMAKANGDDEEKPKATAKPKSDEKPAAKPADGKEEKPADGTPKKRKSLDDLD